MYWNLSICEESQGVFLQDEELGVECSQNGINLSTARRAIKNCSGGQLSLQILTPDGASVEKTTQDICDFLMWSWIPIFSLRARDYLALQGGALDDFLPCYFDCNPGNKFFAHLPIESYDVVDFELSEFLFEIAGDPAIPFNITNLVFRQNISGLPNCFRALAPGGKQILSELFVSDNFKKGWLEKQFTGANFEPLEKNTD